MYVKKKILRSPCGSDNDQCETISQHLSIPKKPGGTWCYGYSLKGAKKFLKYIGKNKRGKIKVNNHIDKMLIKTVEKGIMKAVAFNPPIVWHEDGALRSDSDIPWEWGDFD